MTNNSKDISKHLTNLKNDKLRDFLSGLIAGFLSVTICHPLDIIRTRLNIMSSPNHQMGKYFGFNQAAKMIFKQEGVGGFYLGYRTTVIGVPLFNCLFFPIYEQSKKRLTHNGHSKQTAYCLSSIFAGCICNVLTNPIWVLRTRIMVQYLYPQKHQFIETHPLPMIRKLVQQQGWKSMFKGLSASTLSISNAIIYFLLYQEIKERILQNNKVFNSYYVFAAAIFSKAVSSTLTYPLIVIRTILHDHRADEHLSIPQIIKHIYKQNGLKGFYGGLKPDLVRIIPSNAILFVTYEYMKRVM